MTLVVSFDSLHSHFPKVPRWLLGGMAALVGWAASLPRSLHGVRFASYTGVGLMLLIWVSVVFTVIFNPLDSVDVEPVPLEVDTTRSWVPFSQVTLFTPLSCDVCFLGSISWRVLFHHAHQSAMPTR